jgi:hypothetical protein
MSTVGISMVRNEADVIEPVVRHMATQVDALIVADNGSTDGTREILDQLTREMPLTVVDDPVVGYYQSEKMTALAARAALSGAVWIVPFDADEVWYAPCGARVADALAALPAFARVVQAPLYNHLCTALDEPTGGPFERLVWRQQEPGALPKVAVRWEPGVVIEQGNHGVQLPGEPTEPSIGVLELRHFPIRSAEHLILKARQGAAAYRAAPELAEDLGAHWRAWGRILDQGGEDAIREVFREHWWYRSPVDAGLIYDPAPLRRAG